MSNEDSYVAGDIGVGGREIGFLYGQYKRLTGQFHGVLTGKQTNWGGSHIRPEATGYGCVYFAENWCNDNNVSLRGARCIVSGSGNVAQYTVEKLIHVGAIPLTMSDSTGYVLEMDGFTQEKLEKIMHLKNVKRGTLSEYLKVWSSKIDGDLSRRIITLYYIDIGIFNGAIFCWKETMGSEEHCNCISVCNAK